MKKKLLLSTLIFSFLFTQYVMSYSFTQNKDALFKVKPLPYTYDALKPYIDKDTMILHHDKHYNTYVDNLNTALEKYPQFKSSSLEDLLKNLESIPDDISETVKNNGGGAYNHEFFFDIMSPKKSLPSGELKDALDRDFGSYDNFKVEFKNAALDVFGSGWTWLVSNKDGKLSIIITPNQDSPISLDFKPIIGIDVWEHSYYLKYQNKRAEYIDNWFNVINWNKALENYNTKVSYKD